MASMITISDREILGAAAMMVTHHGFAEARTKIHALIRECTDSVSPDATDMREMWQMIRDAIDVLEQRAV